jgi:hypothetical protein
MRPLFDGREQPALTLRVHSSNSSVSPPLRGGHHPPAPCARHSHGYPAGGQPEFLALRDEVAAPGEKKMPPAARSVSHRAQPEDGQRVSFQRQSGGQGQHAGGRMTGRPPTRQWQPGTSSLPGPRYPAQISVMRFVLLFLLIIVTPGLAQDAVDVVTAGSPRKITAMEKWGLTMEQYLLIDPSRRPSGNTFKYWRARGRGPYGNLVERIPGGPRRPVNP